MSLDTMGFQFPIFNNTLPFSYTPQFNFTSCQNSAVINPFLGFNFPQFNFSNFGMNFSNLNAQPINYTSSTFQTHASFMSPVDFQKKCSEMINTSINYSSNVAPVQKYSLSNYTSANPVFSATSTKTESKESTTSTNISTSDVNYRNLSKTDALRYASNDSHLENLTSGGKRWSISEGSFRNDIPYAAKGAGKVLDKVASIVGQNLVVTSALGTSTSPHNKSITTSHYDSKNPKLDIRGDKKLADKLAATGYFSHVHFEGDHIDVQIKESAYQQFEAVA